jgi:hypothetical protein
MAPNDTSPGQPSRTRPSGPKAELFPPRTGSDLGSRGASASRELRPRSPRSLRLARARCPSRVCSGGSGVTRPKARPRRSHVKSTTCSTARHYLDLIPPRHGWAVPYPAPHGECPRFLCGRPREPAPPAGVVVEGARGPHARTLARARSTAQPSATPGSRIFAGSDSRLGGPGRALAKSSVRPSPSTGELAARRCPLHRAYSSYGGTVTTGLNAAPPTSTEDSGMAYGHAR